MGRVTEFKKAGVKLANDYNSWSGRDAQGRVVITIWSDLFANGRYVFDEPPRTKNGRLNPGHKRLVADLRHARETKGGLVGVVLSRAANPAAVRRVIASCEYRPDLQMRIISLDESTAAFIGVLL